MSPRRGGAERSGTGDRRQDLVSTGPGRLWFAGGGLLALDYLLVSPLVGVFGWARLLAAVGFAALLALTVGPKWRPSLGAWGTSVRLAGRVVVWALLLLAIAGVATALVVRTLDLEFELRPMNVQGWRDMRSWMWFAVLVAPLVEEGIYRGLLQPVLRGLFGGAWAVFLGGFLFWMYHWIPFGGVTPINQLIAGWILGWVYERTRSLVAPILLHAAGNLLVALLDLAVIEWSEELHGLLGM